MCSMTPTLVDLLLLLEVFSVLGPARAFEAWLGPATGWLFACVATRLAIVVGVIPEACVRCQLVEI